MDVTMYLVGEYRSVSMFFFWGLTQETSAMAYKTNSVSQQLKKINKICNEHVVKVIMSKAMFYGDHTLKS